MSHPCSWISSTTATCCSGQWENQTKKYEETAKQHDAKFVPFIMEATGGMSKSAKQIYEMIILASRDNGTLWPHDMIARDFQRSNSHSSTKEECNDYDCWTLSGNRTSCHLCSSIKCYISKCYILSRAHFNLVFGICLLCVLICVCVLIYDWPCSSIFIIYIILFV